MFLFSISLKKLLRCGLAGIEYIRLIPSNEIALFKSIFTNVVFVFICSKIVFPLFVLIIKDVTPLSSFSLGQISFTCQQSNAVKSAIWFIPLKAHLLHDGLEDISEKKPLS